MTQEAVSEGICPDFSVCRERRVVSSGCESDEDPYDYASDEKIMNAMQALEELRISSEENERLNC